MGLCDSNVTFRITHMFNKNGLIELTLVLRRPEYSGSAKHPPTATPRIFRLVNFLFIYYIIDIFLIIYYNDSTHCYHYNTLYLI